MATGSTIREQDQPVQTPRRSFEPLPPETEQEWEARQAIRRPLLEEAKASVKRMEEGRRRKWTREEMLDLFASLRAEFAAKNPGVDPLEEFLRERRAEAERE